MKWLIVLSLSFLSVLCSCEKSKMAFMIMQANTAYNQGHYDDAIRIYKKLVQKNPKDSQHRYHLALAYFSKGDIYNVRKQIIELRVLKKEDLASNLETLMKQQ